LQYACAPTFQPHCRTTGSADACGEVVDQTSEANIGAKVGSTTASLQTTEKVNMQGY